MGMLLLRKGLDGVELGGMYISCCDASLRSVMTCTDSSSILVELTDPGLSCDWGSTSVRISERDNGKYMHDRIQGRIPDQRLTQVY